MNFDTPEMKAAHAREVANAETQRARLAEVLGRKPSLANGETLEYLDWLTGNLAVLTPAHVGHHLTAAELAVRVHMGNAQAKATQHTLVQDGVIEAPPASIG